MAAKDGVCVLYAQVEVGKDASSAEDDRRPKPPYLQTVTQLGLTSAPGMPSLLVGSG